MLLTEELFLMTTSQYIEKFTGCFSNETSGCLVTVIETLNTIPDVAVLGLYSYLAAKPSRWKINATEIRRHFRIGKNKVYRLLNQLITIGLLTVEAVREKGRFLSYHYHLHLHPKKPTVPPTAPNGNHSTSTTPISNHLHCHDSMITTHQANPVPTSLIDLTPPTQQLAPPTPTVNTLVLSQNLPSINPSDHVIPSPLLTGIDSVTSSFDLYDSMTSQPLLNSLSSNENWETENSDTENSNPKKPVPENGDAYITNTLDTIKKDKYSYSNKQTVGGSTNTPYKTSSLKSYQDDPLFRMFYQHYPNKQKPHEAYRAFKQLKPTQEMINHWITDIDRRLKSDFRWQTRQYIPYPENYLKTQYWEGEIVPIIRTQSIANLPPTEEEKAKLKQTTIAKEEKAAARKQEERENARHFDLTEYYRKKDIEAEEERKRVRERIQSPIAEQTLDAIKRILNMPID